MALRPAGALRCVALRTPLAAVRPALSACRPAALQSSFLGTPALGGLCSSLRGESYVCRTPGVGCGSKAAPFVTVLKSFSATGLWRGPRLVTRVQHS